MLPNKILYWSGNQYNSSDDNQVCRINQFFNEAIIRDPKNWLVTVERCELCLNAVPFYTNPLGALQLQPTGGGLPSGNLTIPTVYSLTELIEEINSEIQSIVVAYPDAANLVFKVDKHGYVIIDFDLFNNYDILLGQELSEVLGFPETLPSIAGVTSRKSQTPRFDVGDRLNHIILKTNLPVVSDRIGQVFTKTLADFSVLEAFNSSVSLDAQSINSGQGYSYSPRQQMSYVPSTKRFVNLASDAPIDQIEITAHYTDHRNRSTEVYIPKGAGFSLKLGFYSRR